MKTKISLIALILSIVMLSGCAVHTKIEKPLDDTTTISFGSCSFSVPTACEEEAVDFIPILNYHYETAEDRDVAKVTLSTGAVKGTTETGYMLTSPSYFFYAAKAEGTVDLFTCEREDILSLVNRKDISFENYGRYIANADGQARANMRVDFRITSSNGTSRAYAGYIGLAEYSDGLYYYITGYTHSTITEAQLKTCFNLVRSMK